MVIKSWISSRFDLDVGVETKYIFGLNLTDIIDFIHHPVVGHQLCFEINFFLNIHIVWKNALRAFPNFGLKTNSIKTLKIGSKNKKQTSNSWLSLSGRRQPQCSRSKKCSLILWWWHVKEKLGGGVTQSVKAVCLDSRWADSDSEGLMALSYTHTHQHTESLS